MPAALGPPVRKRIRMKPEDMSSTLIVGAGPAGVSAAWALCNRGIPVTLLDSGSSTMAPPPRGQYLDLRFNDSEQWKWQVGEEYTGLDFSTNASPKLRVPRFHEIFKNYARANKIEVEHDFELRGALAAGGLSTAWGCGVSCFDDDDLGDLSTELAAMQQSYATVARRTGLSGASDDSLRSYFQLDQWAGQALPLDRLHALLWSRRKRLNPVGDFRLGRSRVAVLADDLEGRSGCNLSGTCLWGCARQSTWSAAMELSALSKQAGFRYLPGLHVERLQVLDDGSWSVFAASDSGESRSFRTRRLLLGAGTIATTRLVLSAIQSPLSSIRLWSNPMAAFLLLLPRMLGAPRERAFGLAQLSFALENAHDRESAMGNLFSTAGLPVSEFLDHLPITRRSGLALLRSLMPATVVGNVFMPGSLSNHHVALGKDLELRIHGGHDHELDGAMDRARKTLARNFRRLGGWMLPGSFVQASPGADLHYASTLPIKSNPTSPHHCRINGEVAGLPGVYVIDGASLPQLPAKAHTLTIMANADRIANALPSDTT